MRKLFILNHHGWQAQGAFDSDGHFLGVWDTAYGFSSLTADHIPFMSKLGHELEIIEDESHWLMPKMIEECEKVWG